MAFTRCGQALFGSGSYFAANSSKSDIYTTPNAAGRRAGERCILITRVCLGEGSIASRPCREAIRPPEREDGRGPLNSTVAATTREGGCVEHPEFIVFKEAQALCPSTPFGTGTGQAARGVPVQFTVY